MTHLVLVGACYIDTILTVPHYPAEDEKLRATSVHVRRGGNCPNSLEVLLQLINSDVSCEKKVTAYLMSGLPERESADAKLIEASYPSPVGPANLSLCLYRHGHKTAPRSYIMRSAGTGSRTIVNHNGLPEMALTEFCAGLKGVFQDLDFEEATWWHFEGRVPATTLACIQKLRYAHVLNYAPYLDDFYSIISVEVEKPGREGLRELAERADVVFYSRSWAEAEGYESAEACLRGEAQRRRTAEERGFLLFCTWGATGAAALVYHPTDSHCNEPKSALPNPLLHCGFVAVAAPAVPADQVIDTVGAGDTFVAAILHQLTKEGCSEWSRVQQESPDTGDLEELLTFAVKLASRKVQIEGLQGLVDV